MWATCKDFSVLRCVFCSNASMEPLMERNEELGASETAPLLALICTPLSVIKYTLWSQLESGMLEGYDGIFYCSCGKAVGEVASVQRLHPIPFIITWALKPQLGTQVTILHVVTPKPSVLQNLWSVCVCVSQIRVAWDRWMLWGLVKMGLTLHPERVCGIRENNED